MYLEAVKFVEQRSDLLLWRCSVTRHTGSITFDLVPLVPMERNNVVCVGWGSPTKRPHSWVAAYSHSQRCVSGSEPCAPVDVSRSPCRQRNRKHDTVSIADQNGRQVAWDGVTAGALLGRSNLANPRCRSLIEDRQTQYDMYDNQEESQSVGYIERTDVYRYHQPSDDNSRYLSNGNIKYNRQREINSNVYPEHKHLDTNKTKSVTTYGIDPYNGSVPPAANPEYHYDGRYGSPDQHRTPRNKYPDNCYHLDYNVNQVDWSPEKVSSSGSSFDSGYHSTYSASTGPRDYGTGTTRLGTGEVYHESGKGLSTGKRSSPVHNTHAPYQLSQNFASYQGGIKRTLDKCEDHCIQVIHPSLIWAEQQSEWESIILVKVNCLSRLTLSRSVRVRYLS